jgi:N-acetylglucosamine-6-phosphate deacetylase
MVTLAPELAGAEAFITSCRAHGISVALGHTRADYETARRAFRLGADNLTHTCNAMPPLLHRAPGPIGAALTEGAYVQVISDGVHLHPAMVLSLYRMFGAERMILISDSMRATGLPDGEYDLGGQSMTVSGGVARTHDGALAGGTTPLYACVLRAISFGIPAEEAFRMASDTPARLLGLNKGRIEVGYDADFCLVGEDYRFLKALKLS